MTRHAAAAKPSNPRIARLRADALIWTTALVMAGLQLAQAAPDDCAASASDRDAFVTRAMIETLDAGQGPARHPAWMRAFLIAPEEEGERLARWCEANPDMALRAALDGLSSPEAASLR